MRRRLQTFIPIVLLAMWVQLLAPIGAFRAVASVANDPVAMAAICSGTPTASHNHAAPDMPDQCCAFCAVGHAVTIALDTPPPGFVRLQRSFQQVAWLEVTGAFLAPRVGSNAQARAPPAIA